MASCRAEQFRFEVRAGIDAPEFMAEQRADGQLDGSQRCERRGSKPGVELVERDHVTEARAVVEVVLAPTLNLLAERIPVTAQPVLVHSPERCLGRLAVAHVHATGGEDLDLPGVGLVRLDATAHEHRLKE